MATAAITNKTVFQAKAEQKNSSIKERFPNYLRAYGAQTVYGLLALNRNTDAYRNFSILNGGR
ncbi:MAG: hypothetical protein K2N87_19615 [Eubacterium sp.]|nr:hypothetical protein [Eubacterium sp.]